MKKQLISLGVIIVLILISGIWFGSQDKSQVEKDTFSAIVPNTPLFITIKDLPDFYNKTTSGNPLFDDAKALFPKTRLFPGGNDSITPGLKYLQKLSGNNGGVLALQTSGANKLDFLLILDNKEAVDIEEFNSFFNSSSRFKTADLKSYEGIKIQQVKFDSLSSFISFPDGLFLWSESEILIQNAIRHLQSGENAWEISSFKKLQKTNGAFADANVYIHPNSVFSELDFPLSKLGKQKHFWSKNYAELISADLTIRPNELLWNGFAYATDSTAYFLNTFKGQKPRSQQFLNLIPSSAVYFSYYGFSAPHIYLSKLQDHTKHLNKGFPFEKWLIDWKKNDKRPPLESIKTWLGKEWTVYCTNPGKEKINKHFFAIIELEDPTEFKKWSEKHCVPSSPLNGKNDLVLKFKQNDFLFHIFGESYSAFKSPYVLVKENHLYVFNDRTEMLRTQASINAGIIIEESPTFQSFQNNISSQSNLLVYVHPSGSPDFLLPYFNDQAKKRIRSAEENIKNMESIGYQFSFSKNELYYFNAFIRHNPFKSNQPFALWEKNLDTTLVWGPHYFDNHYSGNKEILVQTANKELILFGTTGKELWRQTLKGKIISDAHIVDGYGNGKYQLLVHTEDHLYLIDRLGRMVENSPTILPSKATGPAGVFDYDDQKDYRIVVPTKDGLFNLDLFGKKVEGWQAKTIKEAIYDQPQHIRIRKRDYILVIGNSGMPYLLSRRGDIRQNTEFEILDFEVNSRFEVFYGKTALESGITYQDKNGLLRNHKFNGRNDLIHSEKVDKNWIISDFNKDGKPDYIFTKEKGVYVKSSGMELKKIISIESTDRLNPHLIQTGKEWNLAVISPEKSKIEFYTLEGKSLEAPPLMGFGSFKPTELFSTGGVGFVTTNPGNKLSTYVLN